VGEVEESIATLIELLANLRKLTKQRSTLRLSPNEIAAAYSAQRDRAPRRSQGSFSSTRCGVMSKSPTTPRAEERLAGALYLRGCLPLPNGDSLKLLDYQFPLKSVNATLASEKSTYSGCTRTAHWRWWN
jgi:hypothetical protein